MIMTGKNSFEYQKFREPKDFETYDHFFYEFFKHIENEFERFMQDKEGINK